MNDTHIIPHLKTIDTGPLGGLGNQIIKNKTKIETWLSEQFSNKSPLLTTSVDIRNASYKISPIDTNIYPAGFNNLSQDVYPHAIEAFKIALDKVLTNCKRILMIPESHTRNIPYFQSISTLKTILINAGFEVEIGSLLNIEDPLTVELPNEQLKLKPVHREGNRLVIDGFNPCLILLNNDLSEGTPFELENLEQPIMPPIQLGWTHRTKTQHFEFYQQIADAFGNLIQIDPWLINPLYSDCGEVDFSQKQPSEDLYDKTIKLFAQIQQKYDEHEISDQPFVVIKADQGTYGMAVLSISDPEQIKSLNRKQRQKMTQTKGKQPVTQVLIQEGIHTKEKLMDNAFAEPVVYMVGNRVIGGFYRFHEKKSGQDVLNAPGMSFQPLTFDDCCNLPTDRHVAHEFENKFYVYSVISRLALLATLNEKQLLLAK